MPSSLEQYHKKLQDPALFAKVLFPKIANKPFSSSLHKLFFDIIVRRPRRVVVIAPRGHGKSSILNILGTLYDIAYDREKFIGVIHKTYKQAMAMIENVTAEIRYNRDFNQIFGPFHFEIARTDLISVINRRTGHRTRVLARGNLQDIRGFISREASRFTKIIGDDMESELNTGTAEQRQKTRRLLYGAVMPALDPEVGKIWLVGTIVHPDCILARIQKAAEAKKLDDEESGWEVHFFQATTDGTLDGEPIWPDRFPKEELLRILETYREAGEEGMFWQEYMNIPQAPGERALADYAFFDGELSGGKLVFADGKSVPVTVTFGIDPALGKVGGDYTGFVVLLTDPDGTRYVYEAAGLRKLPADLVDWFFTQYDRWRPDSIALETVGLQEWLQEWIVREMEYRGISSLPFTDITVNYARAKHVRHAMALSRPLRDRRILLHRKLSGTELTNELDDHPKPIHDDVLDALYLAYHASQRPFEARQKKPEKPRPYTALPPRRKQEHEVSWLVI